MMNYLKIAAVAGALAVAGTSASAVTWTFDNGGGDGTGQDLSNPNGAYEFQLELESNDNGVSDILTTWTATAMEWIKVAGEWAYSTNDIDGSSFDVFGYFIDDVFTQLSIDDLEPIGAHSGTYSFLVESGSTFGFYMQNFEGGFGSAEATAYGNISAVPLPAGGVLLLTALGGLVIARPRKA